ncbi:MAG: DNA internalization-related competence protein ComEC/Rec2 [Vulcanimicrobiaceae bacterium]
MNRAHLVPLALAFISGVASEVRGFALPAIGAGVALALVARAVPVVVRANLLAALALGVLATRLWGSPPALESRSHRGALHAVLLESRAANGGTFESIVRLDDGTLAGGNLPSAPAVGASLEMRGALAPYDEARNPGEPSPRELAADRGLAARLVHARLVRTGPVDERDPTLWVVRARAWASDRLRERLAEPYATILAGAMWGERGALPPDLHAEFQDTGTMHVLVTAGLHLGVVAALAAGLLNACGAGRIGSSLGAIAVVWLYAAFSGAHLPSLRAATMASFALLARASGRQAFSPNALAAAAIVVAALRPLSVTSLSFALSFSCVAAIVLFAKPIASALERLALPGVVREAVALTLATQLGTWPLTAAGFLLIAPYAPLANAAVVPVVGVAMLVGFAQLAATPLPWLAAGFANIETSLLMWIVGVVRAVGALPGAHILATPPPPWAIALYDAALLGAAWLLAHARPRLALTVGALATLICLEPPRLPSHDLVVTAIDVGQADGLLIRTPRGHALMVDAGGRLERGPPGQSSSNAEEVGERIVVPFLIRAGFHHVDAILMSHPHGDHVGGVAPVLRALGADELADSGQSYPGHAYHDALDAARERHVPLLEPRAGDVWRSDDGVTLRFYGPAEPYLSGTRNDVNNNSLVFRLEYGRFRMLFTGDAGAEAEDRLLRSGADLHADVLKVGHHGSAYGTTPGFVAAVAPAAAVVSVGRDNLFGHPAPATLATLEAAGAHVYRTDRDGAVTVESDGTNFSVTPFLKGTTPAQLIATTRVKLASSASSTNTTLTRLVPAGATALQGLAFQGVACVAAEDACGTTRPASPATEDSRDR